MEHDYKWWAASAAEVPDEVRQRAVRMVLEVQAETGEKHGAVTRIAKSSASASSPCASG